MLQNPIFFYGHFMDPDVLLSYGYRPSTPQIVKLEQYELKIGKRATLIKNQQETVWGTIIRLNDKELNELYSMPSVSGYYPEDVKCKTKNGEYINAISYILPENYTISSSQNTQYVTKLIDICKKMSLPLSYQQKLKSYLDK